MIRCRVDLDLSGYITGPDEFVEYKECAANTITKVRIRRFSLLAFNRFFYERLLERQSDM